MKTTNIASAARKGSPIKPGHEGTFHSRKYTAPDRALIQRSIFIRFYVLSFLLCWVLSACTPLISFGATATPSPGKPQDTVVSLTFDDGNADNYAVAAVLKQY